MLADHATAKATELAIATRVRCPAARVEAAIHFDDEPGCRREEIYDEATTEQHFRANLYAELPRFECRPHAGPRML